MIKLMNTIVNSKKSLIGFVVSGRDDELDGLSTANVTKAVRLNWLAERNFKNSQVAITVKSGITLLGDFKLSNLPMLLVDGQNYININNEIELTKRFMDGNETIGYTVKFRYGEEKDYIVKNIAGLSEWFKPMNFTVKHSATGKVFLTGKNGFKIEDLPTVRRNERQDNKNNVREKGSIKETTINNLVDILDIYDFLQEIGGKVVHLPDEKYVNTTQVSTVVDSGFISLGIGELSDPYLEAGEVKLSANTRFRKLGNVVVDGMNIPTFTWSTKTLFKNCDGHIKRFGVVIPKDQSNKFLNTFSHSMIINRITDTSTLQPIIAVLHNANIDMFELNTSNLEMISNTKRKMLELSNSAVYRLAEEAYALKLINKFVGSKAGVLKELKDSGVNINEALDRKPHGLFANMSAEFLEKVRDAGIDIYTEAFTKTVKAPVSTATDTSDDDTGDIIKIQYSIDKLDFNKVKIDQMRSEIEKMPTELIKLIREIDSMSNDESLVANKVKRCKEISTHVEKRLSEIKKALWLHKCAMYLNSGESKTIHSKDKKYWELDAKSRKKTAKVYRCIEQGADGLIIALENIDM